MRAPLRAAVLLVIAALLSPRAAAAVTFGGRAFGGYNTYAMGDWSDVLAGLRAPAGAIAPEDDGYSLGVGADLVWSASWCLTGSYERVVPGRQGEIRGRRVHLPANAVLLELEYRRRAGTRLTLGVGGGGGYYQLGEEVESPGTGQNFAGSAFGGQVYGLGERTITPVVSLGLAVGYRSAKVGVDKVDFQVPTRDIELDYTGLTARLVLRIHQGKR
ncbi:MAG TPA: hypothetical protein VGK89_13890 [Candidatus Eisenbacteria bacterium]|jgi:hypothetical protein